MCDTLTRPCPRRAVGLLVRSSLDAYKAFRLLTSDLGKVFFKPVNANTYKPKPPKSVQASKENFCREQESLEWCFV